MPRPNAARTIASESNLARRIAFERDARGLSYEALATLLTDAGCAIQGSAIYKIEKGVPPRRVTVDELVALSAVFGMSLDDLLTPIELVEQKRAQEIAGELRQVVEALGADAERMLRLFLEYNRLAAKSPELLEYMNNHHRAADTGPFRWFEAPEFEGLDVKLLDKTSDRLNDVFNTLMAVAHRSAKDGV